MKKSVAEVVGIDAEWRPDRKPGQDHAVSVLQLAFPTGDVRRGAVTVLRMVGYSTWRFGLSSFRLPLTGSPTHRDFHAELKK